MLSKVVSSSIFKVFGMTRPGIEPRSPGPLANTLTAGPIIFLSDASKVSIGVVLLHKDKLGGIKSIVLASGGFITAEKFTVRFQFLGLKKEYLPIQQIDCSAWVLFYWTTIFRWNMYLQKVGPCWGSFKADTKILQAIRKHGNIGSHGKKWNKSCVC